MQKKISTLPFKSTPEQDAALDAIIAKYNNDKSNLITVMQEAQDIYGYLPIEVQTKIAEGMDIPLEKVFGVSTFYAQFSLSQKGAHHVAICLGTACYVKGSGKLMEEFEKQLGIKSGEITDDGQFSLDATRCIGACGLAPVLTVGDDVYGRLDEKSVAGIIAKYKAV